MVPGQVKATHRVHAEDDKTINENFRLVWACIYKLFRPLVIDTEVYRAFGRAPVGTTRKEQMEQCRLDTWQGRIRYHRLKNNISLEDVAEALGLSAEQYEKKYERLYSGEQHHYTSLENYYTICKAIGIEFEAIADEYLLFIASPYEEMLAKAIKKSRKNVSVFAEVNDLEYTTLTHSLKRMHKLSKPTVEKYIRVLKKYKVIKEE